MKLNIQVSSFVYSLIYGFLFYYLLDLFNKFVKKKSLFLRIIFSLFFVLLVATIYFLVLLFVNNGYIHIYFLISILGGYIFANFVMNRWFTHKNKNSKM